MMLINYKNVDIYHNDIGGDALSSSALPSRLEAVELAVANCARRERSHPHPAARAPEPETWLQLPIGEVAHKPHLCGVWRPLAERPSLRGAVEAEVLMGARPVGKRLAAVRHKLGRAGDRMRGAPAHRLRIRGEIWIVKQVWTLHVTFA